MMIHDMKLDVFILIINIKILNIHKIAKYKTYMMGYFERFSQICQNLWTFNIWNLMMNPRIVSGESSILTCTTVTSSFTYANIYHLLTYVSERLPMASFIYYFHTSFTNHMHKWPHQTWSRVNIMNVLLHLHRKWVRKMTPYFECMFCFVNTIHLLLINFQLGMKFGEAIIFMAIWWQVHLRDFYHMDILILRQWIYRVGVDF